jgi:circadian clock protein KaiB
LNEPKDKPEKKTTSDLSAAGAERYVLRLYVAGVKRISARAISNLRKVCEEHLAGRYELEVIDILENPALASDEQIVATPTLIKKLPEPFRKLIGDMSNKEKVILGMDVKLKK